jgi:hypothetical protein
MNNEVDDKLSTPTMMLPIAATPNQHGIIFIIVYSTTSVLLPASAGSVFILAAHQNITDMTMFPVQTRCDSTSTAAEMK